jgi:hypothetical protein
VIDGNVVFACDGLVLLSYSLSLPRLFELILSYVFSGSSWYDLLYSPQAFHYWLVVVIFAWASFS